MPKKKQFDKDFKLKWYSLVQDSGLTIEEVSKDLGIDYSTLQRWLREIRAYGKKSACPGSGYLKPEEERIEN